MKGNKKMEVEEPVSPKLIVKEIEELEEFIHHDPVSIARLAAIIQFSEDAIVSKTLEGIVTSWNPGAQKLFGFTAKEMIGQPITKIIPKDRLDEEPEILGKIQRGEVVDHFETKRITKDGKLIDISLTISPIKDSEGKIIGASKIARDITLAKIAEAELKEREQLFRTLTEALPQMIWVRNINGNIEYASKNWENYSGVKNADEAWKAMVHPDDWEFVMNKWKKDVAQGNAFHYEIRLRNKQGEYNWHSSVGAPVKDDSGKVMRWVGALTNIKVQKAFSEYLEKEVAQRTKELSVSNRELKKSQEHFSLLFRVSPVPKLLSTIDNGIIENVNPAWEQMFGKKSNDVIGRTSIEVGIETLEDRTELLKEIEENDGSIHGKEVKFDLGDGKTLYVLLSVVTIEMDGIKYFLTAFADVTERKLAEQKIEQSNAELQQKNKELESFTFISSHDLQEPLRKIQTFASRILEKENQNLSDKGKDLFRRMTGAANRMQTLIRDLLDFSRLNTSERKFEVVDLNKMIEEAAEEFKESILQQSGNIELGQTCQLKLIPLQFRQLLYNLFSNSLKFSKPGVPPHICIKCEAIQSFKFSSGITGPAHRIVFTDNGIGFEPQFKDQIFEVFQMLHGKDEYPGTGIGLSIVRRIVENHNGEISATSELGQGARFDIYLPA